MNQIVAFLSGKKTYIIATLLVLVGIVNLASKTETLTQFLADPNLLIILNGLGLGSVRVAIAKLV